MRHLESVFDGGCILFAVSNIKDNISLILLIISLLNICIKSILRIRKAIIDKNLNALFNELSDTIENAREEVAEYEEKKNQDKSI